MARRRVCGNGAVAQARSCGGSRGCREHREVPPDDLDVVGGLLPSN